MLTDLVLKLRELKEDYNDKVASEILDKVKTDQESNSTNSNWEKTIIDEIFKRTSLINRIELKHFEYLKTMRNASAHPIISESFLLSEVNQETANCIIRNMIESILSKPPYLTKKSIFGEMMSDILRFSKEARGIEPTIHLLNDKYFSRLNDDELIRVFEALWKLVFIVDSDECEETRNYNIQILHNLLQTKYTLLITRIEHDKKIYNGMLSVKHVELIILIVEEFPELYYNDILDSGSKSIIHKHIEENFDSFCYLTILSPSIIDHLQQIIERFQDLINKKSAFEILIYNSLGYIFHAVRKAVANGFSKEATEFVLHMFEKSNDFNLSDILFSRLVSPSLEYFDKVDIEKLVLVINQNSQIHDRKQHNGERDRILSIIKEREYDIDLSNFPNFIKDSPYTK